MPLVDKMFLAVEKIDSKPWLRLLVCIGPGAVLSKLVNTVGASSAAHVVATITLGIGVLVYISWNRARQFLLPEQSDTSANDETEKQVATPADSDRTRPGQVHAHLMAELVALCAGDAAAALRLVSVEAELNPSESYLSAIERAYQRSLLSGKHPNS